jgi:EAL domain-containing protein (putative c-di-GMP-specific phosphodiesterase class I)/CheY-like chemotaxis protein
MPTTPDLGLIHTLLYVEDNPANLKLVEQIIARHPDIRLLTAVNGNSGIEIARVSQPEVILMDINLPDISGFKALKILRSDPATAHIPVIALTANAMPVNIESGLEAGFFRYITKPVKINEFMEALDVALEFAGDKSAKSKSGAAVMVQPITPAGASGIMTKSPISEQQQYIEVLANEVTGWTDVHNHLARAIKQNSFALFYQEIINLNAEASQTAGYEIFVRMIEEEQGLLAPGTFIPLLEHFNMMASLDIWVLRALERFYRDNPQVRGPFFSVNISQQSLVDSGFRNAIREIVQTGTIPGAALCFEIDHFDAVTCSREAEDFAGETKRLGCRVAVDHFGREKITFDVLKQLRCDYVKIDGSLVFNLEKNSLAQGNIRAITRVCSTVGVLTVAQLVETRQTCVKIQELGVNYAQGYLFSKPKPLTGLGAN